MSTVVNPNIGTILKITVYVAGTVSLDYSNVVFILNINGLPLQISPTLFSADNNTYIMVALYTVLTNNPHVVTVTLQSVDSGVTFTTAATNVNYLLVEEIY